MTDTLHGTLVTQSMLETTVFSSVSSEERLKKNEVCCFIELRNILQDGKGWYLRNEIATSSLWIPLVSGLHAGILAKALQIHRVNF